MYLFFLRLYLCFFFFFFFFQAEDGIRDWSVTGVQTCALPISEIAPLREFTLAEDYHQKYELRSDSELIEEFRAIYTDAQFVNSTAAMREIGRASCRERV